VRRSEVRSDRGQLRGDVRAFGSVDFCDSVGMKAFSNTASRRRGRPYRPERRGVHRIERRKPTRKRAARKRGIITVLSCHLPTSRDTRTRLQVRREVGHTSGLCRTADPHISLIGSSPDPKLIRTTSAREAVPAMSRIATASSAGGGPRVANT